MDPRHDPRVKAARRESARAAVIERNAAECKRRYAPLFEESAGMDVALKLMGDPPAFVDEFTGLVRQQVAAGFGLPTSITDQMRSRIELGPNAPPADIRWTVFELLKVVLGGLKPGGRKRFAWSLIDYYERTQWWTEPQFEAAKFLLKDAKNWRA